MTARWKSAALMIAAAAVAACQQDASDTDSAPAAHDSNVTVVTEAPAGKPPAPKPLPKGEPRSRFTSLDVASCKLIERNDAEAGYARHRCAGAAGYQLEVIESDLRQTITVIRPGGKTDLLELSSLVAGGGFSSLGKTAEWRGAEPANPRTLTVRYGVNEDPDPKVAPRSYLVVVRLESPACVVARVSPGPQQSAVARAIADKAVLPGCARR